VLDAAGELDGVWSCPALKDSLAEVTQCNQKSGPEPRAETVRYWMWRFDRADDPIPLDNFWGRTPENCVTALRQAASPFIGIPSGPSDVELIVDVYFPNTIGSVAQDLKGRSAHRGGRNRAMLDGHVAFRRDPRTPLK
jgi:prepilin-type processing-associated H-X9-DG protein